MHIIRLAAIPAIGLLVSSCAGDPVVNPAIRHEITIAAEPDYESLKASDLPDELKMVVTSSTDDLKDNLKRQFPPLRSSSASLVLVEEKFIRHNNNFYRRVWFQYGDETTWSMHGSCSQAILLWFNPPGAVEQTYVDRMSCPI